jgi:hypothetical protein
MLIVIIMNVAMLSVMAHFYPLDGSTYPRSKLARFAGTLHLIFKVGFKLAKFFISLKNLELYSHHFPYRPRVSIRLDESKWPPKFFWKSFKKLKKLTNSRAKDWLQTYLFMVGL